jgi:vitamin B12/bleomycin/antimicrobial peptide transport system ATP-binding/permease protein
MVVGAFNQVQQALRWFVDNFPRIADWRATLLRVVTFREALAEIDALGEHVGRIAFFDREPGNLLVDDLTVMLADGRAALDQPRLEVAPGGARPDRRRAGLGQSTLFRALAGLWPWGSGTIRLPSRETVMFMPQRPYLPLGSLRAAVSYPSEPDRFDNTAVRGALERVDLGHLVASLDRDDRWDKELSLDEQQRLAFARLLLHAPRWVLLDDGTGALEDQHRRLVRSISSASSPAPR